MIGSILKILKAKDIIKTSNLSDYEYYFNNRANINLFLYSNEEKKSLFFIKISNLRDLKITFDNMKIVYDKLPQIVPEPICFFKLNKYQVLVTKSYDIDLLTSKSYFNIKKRKMLLQNVVDNIKNLQSKTIEGKLKFDEEFCSKTILPKVDSFFKRWKEERLLQQEFKLYIRKLTDYYGMIIPSIPQHGDLAMINTGLIEGKIDKIIFFDWDSYSELKLPIYDLLIFLRSFVSYYNESMYGDSKLNIFFNNIFTDYCNNFGLDRDFAIDLYPICLLLYGSLRFGVDTGIVAGQKKAIIDMKQFFANRNNFILRNT